MRTKKVVSYKIIHNMIPHYGLNQFTNNTSRQLLLKILNLVQGEHTPPKFGWDGGWVTVLNRKPAIYLKRGKIEPGYYS